MFIQNNTFFRKLRVTESQNFFFQVRIRSNNKNQFKMKCIEVVDSDGKEFRQAGGVFKKWKQYDSGWYHLDRLWKKCA